MTPFNKISERIRELKQALDALHPIPLDRLQTIDEVFRLEWNYFSNSMEGNTLTFDETRSVMMRQLQINGKPWKDVMEMRGHDEVVRKIQQIGKGDVKITETRIKEIHKEIVFEEESSPHFKEIGKLKQRDNYLYNYRGERMDFITADETQRALNDLSNWLNNELSAFKKGKNTKSILEIAAEHHIRFLYIHPFFDGNGRTGRILMNLILIAQGYPPIIIRTDEKERYNKLITHAQAYKRTPSHSMK